MADNTENGKREIDYHAPVVEFDNNKSLTTSIGFTAKSDEKYEIVWLVPETNEECQARYDCPLSELVRAGVRQLSTRPDYKTVGFHDTTDKTDPNYGTLKAEGHEAMQDLADGYQVGKRVAGVGQKVMAQKAKKAEAELGMSMDEIMATMKSMKEQGLLETPATVEVPTVE